MAGVNSEYRQAIGRLLSLVDAERNRMAGPRQKAIYNLERMERFAERLGHPHRQVPALHIAGTKGKGSTAAMCESALRAAGWSTGFYSSPHLHTFRERLRRDGQPVSEEVFARLVDELWPLRHTGQPAPAGPEGPGEAVTLFEFLTGMAFCCFAEDAVDVQVIEVGLGGRLDATNVLDAAVAVITSVSLDHTQVLGDTVGEIAADKAGIIKPGAIAVIAPQSPEALAPLLSACEKAGARPVLVGRDITWEPLPPSAGNLPHPAAARRQGLRVYGLRHTYELELPLLGEYQQENAATAVAALEAVAEVQGLALPPDAVAAGLAAVAWPCRMEVLADRPLVVADGAHNPYSVASLLRTLPGSLPHRRLLVVAGFSRDKNVAEMAGSLAAAAGTVFAAASRHPRSLPPDELAQLFRSCGAEAIPAATPAQALAQARSQATEDDLILATGSLFLAAEVREAALGIPPEVYPELLTGTAPI